MDKQTRNGVVIGALLALLMAFGFGCTGVHDTAGDSLRGRVTAGPKLANAAAQEQRRIIAAPAPDLKVVDDLAQVVVSATETAGVTEQEFIKNLVTGVISLKEALIKAEAEKTAGDKALRDAEKRADDLATQLASANRRPLYWVAAIVGGVLIVSGAVIAAFGAQLGIAAGAVKGGVLIACGAFALGLMVVVDSILDSTQLALAMWLLVAALAIGLGYALYRWIVQGKTLAVAVAETDKMLTAVDGPAAEAFKASAGRAMDFAHKEVVQLARKAGDTGRGIAIALVGENEP